MRVLLLFLVLAELSGCCEALIERLYCGKHNCYELLEVDRDASSAEVRKAYRKQAMRYHPDKNKDKGSREMFELVSNAYEVLKDEEERKNYDYMLDHPEEVYSHYYRYYRRRTPQVDVRLVIMSTILVVSAIQYLSWHHSHQVAVSAALRMPMYRIRAKEMALSRGLLPGEASRKKRSGKEGKAEEEAILRTIVEENLNITGGYSKPRLLDVFLFRVLFLPYTLGLYLWWYAKWVWQFNIMSRQYGPEELNYLTRKSLKLSTIAWEALEVAKKEELLSRELWVRENLLQWQKEQEEEQRVKYADSSKHKMYRRYKKK